MNPIELAKEAMVNPPQPPSAVDIMAQGAVQPTEEQAQGVLDQANANLMRMLNFRRNYDVRRSQYYKKYVGVGDVTYFPDKVTKRANTFVPYPLSHVETLVSRTLDALFGFKPWFECKGRGANDSDAAEAMTLVLDEKMTRANFLRACEETIRNICIYGHGAMKVDWDWDYDLVTTAQPQFAMVQDPNTGQPVPLPGADGQPIVIGYQKATVPVKRSRPKFLAIDVYDLLVDPDGGMIAHLTEKTLGQIKREAQMNPALYYPEAIAKLEEAVAQDKEPDNVLIRMAELWDELRGTCTLLVFGKDAEAITWKDMRYALRSGSSYRSWKRKVYAGQPLLLWHGENPFMHKRAPIVHTSYIKLPNEVYGMGAVEVISDLVDSMNRMANMITDNWNLGINRRYAYDTQAEIDHDALNNLNVPGGKVGVVGDPSKVIMPLPFMTPTSGDYELMGVYKNMIEFTSGISDFYAQGVGQSSNDTATGISQIIGESSFRFKMFIANMANDILTPVLEMCAAMVQQFVTDDEEVLVTDEPAGIPKFYRIRPEELLGSLSFDLTAANYSTNKIVRQRNVLAFANLAAQSPFIDQYQSLLELGKIFEIPNIRKILKTPEQVQMEQEAAKKEQMEMMIFETMLQTESAAKIAQSKPVTGGSKPGQGAGGGRPRHPMRPEGKTGGAGLTTAIRSMAQAGGLRGLGLEGLGESGTNA